MFDAPLLPDDVPMGRTQVVADRAVPHCTCIGSIGSHEYTTHHALISHHYPFAPKMFRSYGTFTNISTIQIDK